MFFQYSKMKKENSTLNILHVLPRSGGTVVSKSLAAMDKVCLFSEIHLNTASAISQFNILYQAKNWFKLFSDEEYKIWIDRLKKPSQFSHLIDSIQKKLQITNTTGLIREYSRADFIKTPRTATSYKSTLSEFLSDTFDIIRYSTLETY